MQVELLSDAFTFARRAEGAVVADPVGTSVLAGMLAGVRDGTRIVPPGTAWLVVVDNGDVVGVAMHTPPHPPFLPRLPARAGAAVAVALLRVGRQFNGVTGEATAVDEFADAWGTRTGGTSSVLMSIRMYRLDALNTPGDVFGSARRATTGDIELVADWLHRFHVESTPHAPADDPAELASRRVAQRNVWLWEHHGLPVSMAAGGPPIVGVSRIGPVYPPPENRRRGFGAAISAAATRACLDLGARHVVRYTDLGNPGLQLHLPEDRVPPGARCPGTPAPPTQSLRLPVRGVI